MAVTDITLGAASPYAARPVGPQRVYTKQYWLEEWTEQTDLYCEEAVWSAAPSIPTATLHWVYGRVAQTGKPSFAEVLRKDGLNRHYVKIECSMQVSGDPAAYQKRYWYGVLEISEDLILGEYDHPTLGRIATGEQYLTAYGLEHILDQQYINHAHFDADDEGDIKRVERAIVFNREGKKNRSPEQSEGVYHFAKSKETADYWTTRDIAEYLLHYHAPRDFADDVYVPFEFDLSTMAGALPDWDQPVIDPTNRSLYSLLTSLIPRQRLTSFYLAVEDDEEEEGEEESSTQTVKIKPFTYSSVDVEGIGTVESIPPNPTQVRILAPYDPSCEAEVKISTAEKFDQVIIRGARRRTVATFSYADSTLEPGWTTADETTYEAGASGTAGYAALSTDEKRRRNADARNVEKLRNVFSRLQIPWTWDGHAGDGLGEGHYPVFPDDEDPVGAVPQYQLELFVERTLPLLEGVDYSDDKIEMRTVEEDDDDAVRSESPPVCFWKLPGTSRYVDVSRLSRDTPLLDSSVEEFSWSASVTVPHDDRAVRLNVSGAPQHVISYSTFAKLPVDEDLGQHDWTECLVTLSLQDDRFAEERHPADDDLETFPDYINRLYLDAGEGKGKGYRLDYVVPDTVVGVDDAGALIRSDGGYVHDDRLQLGAIAKVAYAWYSRERAVLYLATEQLTTEFELGQLVTSYGQNEGVGHFYAINSPITEIRVMFPQGTPEATPNAPRMRIATDSGQFDHLSLIAPDRPAFDRAAWAEEFLGTRFAEMADREAIAHEFLGTAFTSLVEGAE